MSMIEASNLVKNFGAVCAVNNVSVSIPAGSIVGFLGPNGAGKSTTMRILTGFLSPDSGSVKVCGFDIDSNRLKALSSIGYLPEAVSGFAHLTAREFLEFCCSSRGVRKKDLSIIINRLIKTVDLNFAIDKKIQILSKGWRQRIWLGQAIIHDPPVLILDEPTDGLDPNQKDHLRELIRFIGTDKAIILSTHILEEAEVLCDRVVILTNGKKVCDKPKEKLIDDDGRLLKSFLRFTQVRP